MASLSPPKIKPNLIDTNIITQLQIQKHAIQQGGQDNICSRMWTKLKTDVVEFIHKNFWVLLIIAILGYMLWRRYRWYNSYHQQKLKEEARRKKEREAEKKLEKERKRLLMIRMQQQQEKKKKSIQTNELETKDYGTYDGNVYAMC